MVLIGAKDKRCPRHCRDLQTQVRQTLSVAGVLGGEAIMLSRREAAGRDRLSMAGLCRSTGSIVGLQSTALRPIKLTWSCVSFGSIAGLREQRL